MVLNLYTILSQDQVDTIHTHTLDLLEKVGIHIQHPGALGMLAELGAKIEPVEQRAYFSHDMVEKALSDIPKSFVCGGREAAFDFNVSFDAPPVCRCTGGAVHVFDFTTGKSRPVTLKDCRDIAHIVDGLENTSACAVQTPSDTPRQIYDIRALKVMLESGRKHTWSLVCSSENLALQLEMMLAVAGSKKTLAERPICHGIVTVLEQFTYPFDEIERLLIYGKYKLPVKVPVVPMMGANAPTTIAGTMVQANAEAVAAITLIHYLCPGTPTWYYFFIQAMDRRTGGNIFMSPEIVICSLGLIQMARYYKMPAAPSSYETNGARLTDILYNNGMTTSLYALAGAFENVGTGCLDMSSGISKQGLVIGDDIWGHTLRIVEGFHDDQNAFALDAIHRVSTGTGEYLTDRHTLDYLRKEAQFVPAVMPYHSFNQWNEDPKRLSEESDERVADLLKNHEVPPLEQSVQKELDRIDQFAADHI